MRKKEKKKDWRKIFF